MRKPSVLYPCPERAYDGAWRIGGLDEGLHEAKAGGWTVVDMKADWKRVFAFEKQRGE